MRWSLPKKSIRFSGDGDFRPLVEAIQRRGGLQSGRKRFQLRRVFSLAIIPKVRNQTQNFIEKAHRKTHIRSRRAALKKPGFLRCNAAPRPDDQTPI
jgi:hypothetical protein